MMESCLKVTRASFVNENVVFKSHSASKDRDKYRRIINKQINNKVIKIFFKL